MKSILTLLLSLTMINICLGQNACDSTTTHTDSVAPLQKHAGKVRYLIDGVEYFGSIDLKGDVSAIEVLTSGIPPDGMHLRAKGYVPFEEFIVYPTPVSMPGTEEFLAVINISGRQIADRRKLQPNDIAPYGRSFSPTTSYFEFFP